MRDAVNRSSGEVLLHVMKQFHKISEDFTVNQAMVFIKVGLAPGISQKEVATSTMQTASSVSRIVALLSDRGHKHRKGYGLMLIEPSPNDFRAVSLRLSNKGERVLETIRSLLS